MHEPAQTAAAQQPAQNPAPAAALPPAAIQEWRQELRTVYLKLFMLIVCTGPQAGLLFAAAPFTQPEKFPQLLYSFHPVIMFTAWIIGIVPAVLFAIAVMYWKPQRSIVTSVMAAILGAAVSVTLLVLFNALSERSLPHQFEFLEYSKAGASAGFVMSLFFPKLEKLAAIQADILNRCAQLLAAEVQP